MRAASDIPVENSLAEVRGCPCFLLVSVPSGEVSRFCRSRRSDSAVRTQRVIHQIKQVNGHGSIHSTSLAACRDMTLVLRDKLMRVPLRCAAREGRVFNVVLRDNVAMLGRTSTNLPQAAARMPTSCRTDVGFFAAWMRACSQHG